MTNSFYYGFESATEFSGFYLTPQGHLGSTYHELASARAAIGSYSHRAWITQANSVLAGTNTNHRGYPTFQFHKAAHGPLGPKVRISLKVWLDVALTQSANADWFSFATFTSYADDEWPRTLLVNLHKNGYVHLMHIPGQGQQVQDITQRTDVLFPQRQWVQLQVFIDFSASNSFGSPYAKVWQDGVLVSAGRFNPRIDPASVPAQDRPPCLGSWDGSSIESAEALCGFTYKADRLAQAHFGFYGPPLLLTGEVYNDDLTFEILTKDP